MDGGLWTFNNHLLILHELKAGEDPVDVPLFFSPFWLQVHDLPSCLFSEVVGTALGNYAGTFISYNSKNKKTAEKPYMRLRVLLDVRVPLKKEKKIKKASGDWVVCSFKYEKLTSFCFLCRLLGHIDRHCEQFYMLPEEELVRHWDVSLCAPVHS